VVVAEVGGRWDVGPHATRDISRINELAK
jgi:hypothetical protein